MNIDIIYIKKKEYTIFFMVYRDNMNCYADINRIWLHKKLNNMFI